VWTYQVAFELQALGLGGLLFALLEFGLDLLAVGLLLRLLLLLLELLGFLLLSVITSKLSESTRQPQATDGLLVKLLFGGCLLLRLFFFEAFLLSFLLALCGALGGGRFLDDRLHKASWCE